MSEVSEGEYLFELKREGMYCEQQKPIPDPEVLTCE